MTYTVASFSGGKDSTAMVLHMIELGDPIDEVITCDTGMEFPEMYDHITRVRKVIEDAGVKFTTLRADHSFEWFMFEKEVARRADGGIRHGYGWPAPRARWCTRHLKTDLMTAYSKALAEEHGEVTKCVGLAADEIERTERDQNKGQRWPLIEWGWTEADALAYCKAKGYDWGGLYDIYRRVSCWICPLAPIGELRKLRHHHPELWARILAMDAKLRTPGSDYSVQQFNMHYSVQELDARFAREDKAAVEQTDLGRFFDE